MSDLSEYYTYSCDVENLAALLPEVWLAFSCVAKEYFNITGEKLHITSGKRSLKHCATLMAEFSREQLEGMYCRRGYPDYIRSIVSAMEAQGRSLTADEVYQILQNRQEGYISWHLAGGAVDISSNVEQPELLKRLLAEKGFSVLNEQEFGIGCFHAVLQGLQPVIVRE